MDSAEIGARLRTLRQERGLTQEDIAAAVNRTRAWVSYVETGAIEPPLHLLAAFAREVGAALFVAICPDHGADAALVARLSTLLPHLDTSDRRTLDSLLAAWERYHLPAAGGGGRVELGEKKRHQK